MENKGKERGGQKETSDNISSVSVYYSVSVM